MYLVGRDRGPDRGGEVNLKKRRAKWMGMGMGMGMEMRMRMRRNEEGIEVYRLRLRSFVGWRKVVSLSLVTK